MEIPRLIYFVGCGRNIQNETNRKKIFFDEEFEKQNFKMQIYTVQNNKSLKV